MQNEEPVVEKAPVASTPEPEVPVEVVPEPVVVQAKASSKAKASKQKKSKMPIEEVDESDNKAAGDRVPVNEPIIVKEEAILLYNGR